MAQGRQVHPNLMGSPGLELDLQQCGPVERLDHLVMGDRRLPGRHDGELELMRRVATDRRVHRARHRVRQALDEGVVGLVDGARAEGVLEPGMVVTVEPGLYYNQWGGVRWEYTVLVEEDGVRIL